MSSHAPIGVGGAFPLRLLPLSIGGTSIGGTSTGPGRDAGPDDGLSEAMGLREFYRQYVAPVVLRSRDAAAANFQQYEESVKLWVIYTTDPPLAAIGGDPRIHRRFARCLKNRTWRGKPIGSNTIRKHLGAIQFLLDLAGPKVPGLMGAARPTNEAKARRDGLFGLDEDGQPRSTPYLQRPAVVKRSPEAFTLGEITAWLAASRDARFPRDVPPITPADWWRAIVLWTTNVGTRIGTTLALRWDWLDGHSLRVPADALKGRRVDQTLFVNRHALAAIEPLRPAGYAAIFPWPHQVNYLQTVRRRLLEAAGIPKPRRFGFHGLRKFLATELARSSPIASQKALGHTGMAMTRDHYIDGRVVEDAMQGVSQPAEFEH